MRYRVAVLLLFSAVPTMAVLAAPAPEPSAILDIGPPQRGEPLDEHRKWEMGSLTCPAWMVILYNEADVKKLSIVASQKYPVRWLLQNIRVVNEDGGTRLRLTFRGGNRREQVIILKALLRSYIREKNQYMRWHEENLRKYERAISDLIKNVDSPPAWKEQALERSRTELPKQRTLVAACKKIAVIKWAK